MPGSYRLNRREVRMVETDPDEVETEEADDAEEDDEGDDD